eukprot:858196-Prymnesium_polylepis.2
MLQAICGEVTLPVTPDDEQTGAPAVLLNMSDTCRQARALLAPQLLRLKTCREQQLLARLGATRQELARLRESRLQPAAAATLCACVQMPAS